MFKEPHGFWILCYENRIKAERFFQSRSRCMPLIYETVSTLRQGARMLVNWPVNQIGLSLEPDKGSIIYLRQKQKKRAKEM